MKIGKKKFNEKLEEEIISLTGKLSTLDPSDASYAIVAENLSRLYEARSKEKEQKKFNWDPVIIIVGQAATILLIAAIEKEIIIPQKLFSFIPKGRV